LRAVICLGDIAAVDAHLIDRLISRAFLQPLTAAILNFVRWAGSDDGPERQSGCCAVRGPLLRDVDVTLDGDYRPRGT